ncbi:hypothetical protein BH11PSE11_BH11PSE11_19090 [soil metagenome]
MAGSVKLIATNAGKLRPYMCSGHSNQRYPHAISDCIANATLSTYYCKSVMRRNKHA